MNAPPTRSLELAVEGFLPSPKARQHFAGVQHPEYEASLCICACHLHASTWKAWPWGVYSQTNVILFRTCMTNAIFLPALENRTLTHFVEIISQKAACHCPLERKISQARRKPVHPAVTAQSTHHWVAAFSVWYRNSISVCESLRSYEYPRTAFEWFLSTSCNRITWITLTFSWFEDLGLLTIYSSGLSLEKIANEKQKLKMKNPSLKI